MQIPARLRRLSTTQVGAIAVALALVIGTLLFLKTQIGVALRAGETVTVEFSRDYKVRPNVTRVKVAGVPIGVVTDVEAAGDGSRVTLKVDEGIRELLGSEPSAAIRPTTILGGNYYIDLKPGGDRGVAAQGPIPATRTTVPVELDATVGMLTRPARDAVRQDIALVDDIFSGPATPALRRFVRTTPPALRSSALLLRAVAGTRPAQDLTDAISGLDSVARQLTEDREALAADIEGLATVASTFADRSADIRSAVDRAPQTLRSSRSGLERLDSVLAEVIETSEVAMPSAEALTSLLRTAPGDLSEVRPVVRNLRPLMKDLSPALADLDPSARKLQTVVNDVKSPVISRINGPVLDTLNSPVGGADSPLGYEQIAYMFTILNLNSMTTDSNGAMINFQPGVGPDTATEFGIPRTTTDVGSRLLSLFSSEGR
ncbi:MlaD family protein [Nocardioides sp.]|uniref:MlaD family protein n=1 Tax=Nocardioides sp. TaxID=35761 RepID=UPI003512B22F